MSNFCNYQRHLSTLQVGWIFELPSERAGIMFLMRQADCTATTVKVALRRPQWPWSSPAPLLVRSYPATRPQFRLLSGAPGVSCQLDALNTSVAVTFARPDAQALFGYSF